MNKLRIIAIAYILSFEFGYCPNTCHYQEAKDYFGDFPLEVLEIYQGFTPDELARKMAEDIING